MAKLSKTESGRQQMVKDLLRRKLFTASGSISQKCWYYWSADGVQSGLDDFGRRGSTGKQHDGVDA